MTNDERSRLVAEAIGLRECCALLGRGHSGKCNWPFDLADAKDREKVITWYIAKAGGDNASIVLRHFADACVVDVFTKDDRLIVSRTAPTIGEALGDAFLAAIGGEQ